MSAAYVGRQLAGVGSFKQTTNLFGTTLMSQGDYDLAVFRVDLDRTPYNAPAP